MRSPTGTLLDLRDGERALVGVMFLYSFALLVTLYLLKPARDSLFLTELGPTRLPFVFLATAAAVVPVTMLYGRIGRRVRLSQLVNGTTLVLIASLVALRWAVSLEADWVFFLLYVWVSIYSVLATSQYWLLAGAVFDPQQSKRIFALLSFGAILGAVVGGELTGLLVERWGVRTRDLLWVAVGVLVLTVGLVNWIRVRANAQRSDHAARSDEATGAGSAGSVLKTSRHLQLITAVIAVAVLTTAIVDFQFKTVSTAAFPVRADLTTFMGRFYGRVSLIALAFQFFLAPRIIRMRGVGGAMLLLPVALAVGSVAMLAAPGLIAATMLRGADQSLKHSIDRTGRELLFLPVPLAAKKQVKVFIDVFVDQGMQGLGGLVLLAALALGLTVQSLSGLVLVLVAVWIGLVLWARRSYIQAFREALPSKEAEESTHGPAPSDLLDALSSPRSQRVEEALERLDEAAEEVPAEQAEALLRHRSARVRRRVIALLARQGDQRFAPAVEQALRDRDARVRLEAARYLYGSFGEDRARSIRAAFAHQDVRARAAMVAVVAQSGTEEDRALVTDEVIGSLLAYAGPEAEDARAGAARALGALGRPGSYETLRALFDDPSPLVVRAAIEAAGRSGNRLFVGRLLRFLEDPPFEKAARAALRAYGPRIFGTLYDYLTDDTVPEPIRRNIPRILVRLPTQSAVDLLLLSLEQLRAPLLYDVAKALNKIRRTKPGLRFSRETLDAAVLGEIRALATVQAALFHHARSPDAYANGPGGPGVRAALARERAQSLERVFRLLGLRYPSADMHSAFLGLTESSDLRASAAEFLDTLLDWEFKRYLVPLLDDTPDLGDVRVAEEMAGRPFPTWQTALHDLLMQRHPRPLACALAALPEALPPPLAELAHVACTPDPSDDPPAMRKVAPPFRPSSAAPERKPDHAS